MANAAAARQLELGRKSLSRNHQDAGEEPFEGLARDPSTTHCVLMAGAWVIAELGDPAYTWKEPGAQQDLAAGRRDDPHGRRVIPGLVVTPEPPQHAALLTLENNLHS